MKYPAPLVSGSTVAITAFSSGISEEHEERFQFVKRYLGELGFHIVEGQCLRGNRKSVSASKEERASELMAFLLDENINAIAPPWGGELAIELLPLLDFEKLAHATPKWVMGFSDISTITSVLTIRLGWATAHSPNLMDLTGNATERLTANTFSHLALLPGDECVQLSSEAYTRNWPDITRHPEAVLDPSIKTEWKWLVNPTHSNAISGKLIGGCWDTLINLFNTEYLDLKQYQTQSSSGVILFLENVEMSPEDLVRALSSMKFRGVFDCINALILGRNTVDDSKEECALTYHEVLMSQLAYLGIPVMYDLDIGHVPPNLTLINGADATITIDENGKGTIIQTLV